MYIPANRAEAALLAASKWACRSGLLNATFDPRGVFTVVVGVEVWVAIRAARIGCRRPNGALLAPVAISGMGVCVCICQYGHRYQPLLDRICEKGEKEKKQVMW